MNDYWIIFAAFWSALGISAMMYDMAAKNDNGILSFSSAITFFLSMFWRGVVGFISGPIAIIFAVAESRKRR